MNIHVQLLFFWLTKKKEGPMIMGPECTASTGMVGLKDTTIIYKITDIQVSTNIECYGLGRINDEPCPNDWGMQYMGVFKEGDTQELFWGANYANPKIKCQGDPFPTTFTWDYAMSHTDKTINDCCGGKPYDKLSEYCCSGYMHLAENICRFGNICCGDATCCPNGTDCCQGHCCPTIEGLGTSCCDGENIKACLTSKEEQCCWDEWGKSGTTICESGFHCCGYEIGAKNCCQNGYWCFMDECKL